MKKTENRFAFQCWNCNRKYTLLREITENQTLAVACPYCNAEGVVDLAPYKKAKKETLKAGTVELEAGFDYAFPDVLPTQQPKPDEN